MGYNRVSDTTNFDRVWDFHVVFDSPVGLMPQIISNERKELRVKLMEEEFEELEFAMNEKDLVGIAKEAVDLLVVTYGTLVEYGINADAIFEMVHKSNMSKLGEDGKPIKREDGKILKGPNYKKAEPEIEAYLKKLGYGQS